MENVRIITIFSQRYENGTLFQLHGVYGYNRFYDRRQKSLGEAGTLFDYYKNRKMGKQCHTNISKYQKTGKVFQDQK